MKKILSFVAVGLVAFLLIAPVASAAEFISGGDKDGNVTLSSTEKHHNAYVAGGSVFVNSPITGDLYAAAGDLTIEASVEQDVVVAGGTVIINGPVGGDVRVVGGDVIINGKISGDLVTAGGTVRLTEKGSVGGDAYVAGGQVTFDGPVGANMKVRGGQVTINNSIFGKVDVMVDETLTFGSKAVVESKVSYKGPKEAVIQDGAKVGEVDYKATQQHSGGGAGKAIAGFFAVMTLVKLLGVIILGLILIKLFPRSSNELTHSFMQKPWVNMGIGFLALVVGPIAVVIVLITIVGMYVAILAFLVWLVLLLIASILACVFAGVWLMQKLGKKTDNNADWQSLVAGSVALTVIGIVPVIGGLIFFVIMLMAFGSLLRHLQSRIQDEQSSVKALPPVAPVDSTPIDSTPTDSTPDNQKIA